MREGLFKRNKLALVLAAVIVAGAAYFVLLRGFTEGLKTPEPLTIAAVRKRAEGLILNFDSRYFLTALDAERLDALCDIYESAMDFEQTCGLNGISPEKLSDVVNIMLAECPELYQLDTSTDIVGMTSSSTGNFVSIDLRYLMGREEYEDSRARCEEMLDGFVRQTEGLSDENREKFVFDYIASSCRYDVDAEYAGTARGALLEGEAKCDGISAAMKWAMEEMDIPCVTLTAEIVGDVDGHAWNAVELDGEWYRVDLTQSVRIDEFIDAGIDDIVYYAFNISDDFAPDRYVVLDCFGSVRELPKCDSMERSWFAAHDLYISDASAGERIVDRELASLAGAGGGSFTVQFERKSDFTEFPDSIGETITEYYDEHGLRFSAWRCRSLPYNVCIVTVFE